jgi:hypothetical protein
MYGLSYLLPFIGQLCFANFVSKQGELCNFRQPPDVVLKYDHIKPEEGCTKDGVFYPRCKDLENPEILAYHNLFYGKK